MTTLADLSVGDAFVLLSRVAALDQVAGMTLIFFGPDRQPQGQLVVSPAGVISGQLVNPANQTPVNPVTHFRVVSVGSVLVNQRTGETMVVRQVSIQPDGTYQWSPSLTQPVWYTIDGWQLVGNVNLS